MNGNEIYESNFINRINNVIDSNPDLECLSGYYYFLGDVSFTTGYNYVNYVVDFLRKSKVAPNQLTLDHYTSYLNGIRRKTSSYQIVVYSALKKFSLYLMANQINTNNPMQYIPRPKAKESNATKRKRENGYLNENEIRTLIGSVVDGVGNHHARARQEKWKERDLLIVQILLNTGMRCSALYKLDVSSIDFKKKVLHTVDKGDEPHTYRLSEDVIVCAKNWLARRGEILDNKNEDALFISERNTRMSQSAISNAIKKYSTNITGKNITPHKLRATYGTQLYNKTGDLYFVQQCMNHSSPKTTEIYIRGQKNANAERAANIMSELTMM